MADVWWTPKAEKLTPRRWSELRDEWAAYAPIITQPGAPPQIGVADLTTLQAAVSELRPNQPQKLDTDIAGLQTAILQEGIFLLHKGANSLAGAQVHVAEGMRSWSLSSAYQSAFFSMKAIQHFLGFAVAEINSKSHMIDVMPEPERLSSNQRKKGMKAKRKTLLIRLDKGRLDHQPMWGFFRRLIRNLDIANTVWPTLCVTALIGLQDDSFARQRNLLHYHNNKWPFLDDLHATIVEQGFGTYGAGLDNGTTLDVSREDFSGSPAEFVGRIPDETASEGGEAVAVRR